MGSFLEFDGNHGDGDTGENDSGHGEGSVALPVLGATIGSTRHTPNFGSEIPGVSRICVVSSVISTHFSLVDSFLSPLYPLPFLHSKL